MRSVLTWSVRRDQSNVRCRSRTRLERDPLLVRDVAETLIRADDRPVVRRSTGAEPPDTLSGQYPHRERLEGDTDPPPSVRRSDDREVCLSSNPADVHVGHREQHARLVEGAERPARARRGRSLAVQWVVSGREAPRVVAERRRVEPEHGVDVTLGEGAEGNPVTDRRDECAQSVDVGVRDVQPGAERPSGHRPPLRLEARTSRIPGRYDDDVPHDPIMTRPREAGQCQRWSWIVIRGPNAGFRNPEPPISRTTRSRCPRHGSRSSSMPSSSTGPPASAHPTSAGTWKSPTLGESGSPWDRCAVSAAVHGPMPGTDRSRCDTTAPPRPRASVRSSAGASFTARITVAERPGSMPARCHSQLGIRAHCSGVGGTNISTGTGPGARSPKRRSRYRQARQACREVTFCSITAGTSIATTVFVRSSRSPGCRCRASARKACALTSRPDQSSPRPSRSGAWVTAQAAPSPHADTAIASLPARRTSTEAAPAGVRRASHVSAPTTWKAGSPEPRCRGRRVARTSTAPPGRYTVSTRPAAPDASPDGPEARAAGRDTRGW
ncbi:hypothetical protein Cus16_2295 [Curtobacterium sp. ER1/6]|nr:hypothetical protein Cus16_2295 [Curtobacterium sp. ER1/6]